MPQGETKGVLVIGGEDGAYSGTLTTDNGQYELRDISVSGNVMKFMFDVDSDGQSLEFESDVIIKDDRYKGKLNVMMAGSTAPVASFEIYGMKK